MRRYGFFKNKRIVLYDTLIEQCREPEVVAVLAHELGRSPGLTSHALLHTLDRIACVQTIGLQGPSFIVTNSPSLRCAGIDHATAAELHKRSLMCLLSCRALEDGSHSQESGSDADTDADDVSAFLPSALIQGAVHIFWLCEEAAGHHSIHSLQHHLCAPLRGEIL